MKGKIKFFNSSKGFGFIISDEDNSKEYFFHKSNVSGGSDSVELKENDKVEFEPGETEKGLNASNVSILD